MTEADWLSSTDPQAMLLFLRDSGRAGERKLRLFACACCRRIWHLLRDARSRDAVEVAERFADGLAGDVERSGARRAAQQVAQSRAVTSRPTAPKWERRAASAVYYATAHQAIQAAGAASQLAAEALIWRAGGYAEGEACSVGVGERCHQASALRDLFGLLPFREVRITSSLLDWQHGTIVKLALAAYEERTLPEGTLDPARLAVLADALEEAGCTDPEMLSHLRGPGPHVRGCWPVDLVRSVD